MGPAATSEATRFRSPTPIETLSDLLAEDMAAVDALLRERTASSAGVIPNLAMHLIDAGGKRIRPLITLGSARLLGGGGDRVRRLAAAVEFIHTATLLHDDVVDDSGLRRGKQSANRLWGNQASVLVGDFLFARSFNLMVEAGDLVVLDILARAASVIAEGEVMQLSAQNDSETTAERYLEIIDAKTAALFAAAAKSGAVAAGHHGGAADSLEIYGRNLGLAFQLVDDALDYDGRQAALGKNVGDDFRDGKVTMPVVFARDEGDAEERDFWRRVMSGDQREEDLAKAQSILRRYDAIVRTLTVARGYADRARAALDGLPRNAFSDALMGLPDFVVDRGH